MKTSLQQGDAVTAPDDSSRLRLPSLSSSWPRQPNSASVDLPARLQPLAGEDRDAFGLRDVYSDAAIAVATWLVLLGFALSALLAVTRGRPAVSPGGSQPSEVVVAPGISEMESRPPGFGREFMR